MSSGGAIDSPPPGNRSAAAWQSITLSAEECPAAWQSILRRLAVLDITSDCESSDEEYYIGRRIPFGDKKGGSAATEKGEAAAKDTSYAADSHLVV